MLDEQDDVGADVYPWPCTPMATLDEQDDVGADVYPWPRSPMATLDVQRDAIKIGRVVELEYHPQMTWIVPLVVKQAIIRGKSIHANWDHC
jgi:hypothetical protein